MQIAKSQIKNIETSYIQYNFSVDSVKYTIQYNPQGKGNYELIGAVDGQVRLITQIFSYQLSIKQAKDDLIRFFFND